jgi:BirA family biotin operon repressor/biotin-[acetyl-CoA-carboxylase] ligase
MHTPVTKAVLLPHGPLQRLGRELFIFDDVDSTNAWLLAQAAELPDGTVASAEYQSAGRGRLGRRWEAPRGSSVLLSVLLREPPDSPLTRRVTVLAALAACEAIELVTLCRPEVRWPNDLVIGGRKLGGVLVEATPLPPRLGTPAGTRAVVVGIGVNCLQQRGHFPAELADQATSLELESPQPVDRTAVGRHLLERLDANLVAASQSDAWPGLLRAWKARCDEVGGRVELQQDRRSFSGTVLDISEDGHLLVHLDEGGCRYFDASTTTRRA